MRFDPIRKPGRDFLWTRRRDLIHKKRLAASLQGLVAAIAQLVEHLIRNEGVLGSNPSCGTNHSA